MSNPDGLPRQPIFQRAPRDSLWLEGSAGIGEVEVSASVPPFAGAGLGYVNDDDLRVFAEAISVYPLRDGPRPALTTGLDDQETVGITVSRSPAAVSWPSPFTLL